MMFLTLSTECVVKLETFLVSLDIHFFVIKTILPIHTYTRSFAYLLV